MAVSNAELAGLLRSYAAVLKLEGVDRFKLKAYLRAADSVESTSDQVATLVAQGEDLTKLPGIGEAISEKLTTIIRTGKLPQLERALEKLEPAMAELAARPALDPSTEARLQEVRHHNS